MRKTLGLLLAVVATPALASPQSWCQKAQDQKTCIDFAEQDDRECSGFGGVKYDNCRQQLLVMHKMTGTPPGPIEMGECTLPSGAVITMNVKTCEQQGGTVN